MIVKPHIGNQLFTLRQISIGNLPVIIKIEGYVRTWVTKFNHVHNVKNVSSQVFPSDL